MSILLWAQTSAPTWEAALRDVASRMEGNVVVDVVRSVEPLVAPATWSASSALSLVAGATWCTLTEMDSGLVVHRSAPDGSDRGLLANRFVQFCEGLTSEQVLSLSKGEAHLSDLDIAAVAPLLASLSLDRQNLAVMLGEPEAVGISLGFTLTAEYIDPTTSLPRTATVVQTVSAPPQRAAATRPKPTADPVMRATPRKQIKDAFVVEPGRIWRVKDLIETVTRTLGVKFIYDKRFADAEVFLSGSFTAEQLDEALRLVLAASPVRRRLDESDETLRGAFAREPLRSLVDRLFPRSEARDALSGALSGESVLASKLTVPFSSFRERLERESIDPTNLNVRLKLEPTFKIRIEGLPVNFSRYGIVVR
ncbi:MAG TPA: hypothetical protein PLV39_05830 [Fimbriimonadaceae bacterium]|nr:hypothetical protein [Fimbriimonadaceae bacterium]